jgi:hypothetical protein
MMGARHEHPDHAEATDSRHCLGIGRVVGDDGEAHASADRLCRAPEARLLAHLGHVGREHPADRGGDVASAGHLGHNSSIDMAGDDSATERDVIHVGQMMAKRLDVDLGPIRGGIGLEASDDLRESGKRRLSGFSWRCDRRGVAHAGSVLMALCSNGERDQGERGL